MNRLHLFLIILFNSFIFISCEDDTEQVVLKLSEHEHMFEAAGGVHKVTATTNDKNNFIALWQGENWGYVKQEGNQIEIIVSPNDKNSQRTSSVLVVSSNGILKEEISITQKEGGQVSPSNPYFRTLFDNVEFNADAERQVINIETNLHNWGIGETPSWIEVVVNTDVSQIEIFAHNNEDINDRETEVVILSGDKPIHAIKVVQKGVPFYILPYMDFKNGNIALAKKFEMNRGSVSSATNYWTYEYFFSTQSVLVPSICYRGHNQEAVAKITGVILYLDPDRVTEQVKEGYIEFLKENGFTFNADFNEEGYSSYINEKKAIESRFFHAMHALTFAPIQ